MSDAAYFTLTKLEMSKNFAVLLYVSLYHTIYVLFSHSDRYFVYLVECKEPKACTIVLRGASKDVLNEIDRNLQDAMCVARNIFYDGRLVYGGGAIETAVSYALLEKAKTIEGVQQWPYKAVAEALEVIPRTLTQNCGASAIRILTQLRVSYCI